MLDVESTTRDWDIENDVGVEQRVKLIRPLKLWRYKEETMSLKGMFNKTGWEKERMELAEGSMGTVLHQLDGRGRYRVKFDNGAIVHGVKWHDLEWLPPVFYPV